MAALMEYFNRVAASFTSTERGEMMVKLVKQPVERPRKCSLEPSGAG